MGHVECSEGCFVLIQYKSCWINIGDIEYTLLSFPTPKPIKISNACF